MRLDGGRFYGFPTDNKNIEHFWLCGNCARTFTLRYEEGQVLLSTKKKKIA
ncbi:MAG TPA: hypothetical protein VFB79_06260 [Candidatus Angelobacter sp.]|nr:hypothetical protein [Candidatus Angelobacter sp.]